jgi:hypothetical protein
LATIRPIIHQHLPSEKCLYLRNGLLLEIRETGCFIYQRPYENSNFGGNFHTSTSAENGAKRGGAFCPNIIAIFKNIIAMS